MNESCLSCPSYMGRGEGAAQVNRFGKSLNSPMCARFGRVLGSPNSTAEQDAEIGMRVGNSCSSHGKPRPKSAETVDLSVMLPDPASREVGRDDHRTTSCSGCRHFIPADDVQKATGWTMAMCASRGELISPTEYVSKAGDCAYNTYGSFDDETPDIGAMRMLPELRSLTFIESADPVAVYKRSKKNFVDPVDYETDAPVADEHKAEGIRAWRRVDDPEGTGNHVMLPIFNLDFFSPGELVKIPRTGEDEHSEEYIDHQGLVYKSAVLWRELDETPALWGVAGTGKTEFFRHMAWLMCLPFERISVTNSTELDDLAGKMHFRNSETIFEYGRIPKAWSRACVLCIDEPNVGPPDVWQFIRPLTDSSKQLVLDMNSGERITRNDHAYLGMAMNPSWDARNVGTSQISDADGSRLMHIYVTLPAPELEREIILNRCKIDGYELPKEKLDILMRIAKDLRQLADDGTIPVTWGVRPQIKVARATRYFSWATAFNLAAADYLDPDSKQAILEVVKSHAV